MDSQNIVLPVNSGHAADVIPVTEKKKKRRSWFFLCCSNVEIDSEQDVKEKALELLNDDNNSKSRCCFMSCFSNVEMYQSKEGTIRIRNSV
uniref:Uncharacterized protein n=1 Tax=Manihot esculenta TaxID=3983 RepID=A0A2C9W695_MANES